MKSVKIVMVRNNFGWIRRTVPVLLGVFGDLFVGQVGTGSTDAVSGVRTGVYPFDSVVRQLLGFVSSQ